MRKHLMLIFQILVTAILLTWIFQNRDIRLQLMDGLKEAKTGWLAIGILISLIYNLLGVVRWNIFLRLLDIRLSFLEVIRIYFIGLLFNTFLIGQLGGDAVKILILVGQKQDKVKVILSVVLDRISGLASLVITSWILIQWKYSWLMQSKLVAGLIDFVVLYLMLAITILIFSFIGAKLGFAGRWREKMRLVLDSYLLFIKKWKWSLVANGISLLMLLGYYSIFFCAARAFTATISLFELYALMPIVDIITSLPISVGGIGVREHLFIALLGNLCGVPEAEAVLVSMFGFLMTIIWGVVGIFLRPSHSTDID